MQLYYIIINHLKYYPTPKNLTVSHHLSAVLSIFLILQVLTGLFLTTHMYYDENTFYTLNKLPNKIKNFGLVRNLHANTASFFIGVMYMHMFRYFYYHYNNANARKIYLFSSISIFFVSLATAFTRYVLPNGQMSFWGATIITNIIASVPKGDYLLHFLWGTNAIGAITLRRFFLVHVLLAGILVFSAIIHLILLHNRGNTVKKHNLPDLTPYRPAYNNFYPYHILSNSVTIVAFLIPLVFISFFFPDVLGNFVNYQEADPLVTPSHIVPKWYFLPYYAVLKCIPNKFWGIVLALLFLCSIILLPILSNGGGLPLPFLINVLVLADFGDAAVTHTTYVYAPFCIFLHLIFITYKRI